MEGLQESPDTETEIKKEKKEIAPMNKNMKQRKQKTKERTSNEIPTNEKITQQSFKEECSKVDEVVTLFYKGNNELEIPELTLNTELTFCSSCATDTLQVKTIVDTGSGYSYLLLDKRTKSYLPTTSSGSKLMTIKD